MRRSNNAVLATRRAMKCLVAFACFFPAIAAHAGDPKPAAPRLVHVGDQVCLVYRDAGGTQMARCRPKDGTWADAAPPVPASYSGPGGKLVLHATKAAIARRAAQLGRGRACLYLGGGALVLAGALFTALASNGGWFCGGDPGCVAGSQVMMVFGVLSLSVGTILVIYATQVSVQWDVDASGLHVFRVGW